MACCEQESTSEPGRAQCSSWTANLIRAACPANVKLERRGEVQIKGKGVMETFWVLPDSECSTAEAIATVTTGWTTPPGERAENRRNKYPFRKTELPLDPSHKLQRQLLWSKRAW